MLYLGIFFAVFFLLLILLLLLKVNVLTEYLRNGWDDHIVLSIFALKGRLKYKYEIPLVDVEKNGIKVRRVEEVGKHEKDISKKEDKMRFFEIFDKIQYFKDFYKQNRIIICDIRDYLRKRLILKEYSIEVEAGSTDAFYTGILNGVVWAVTGIITSFLSNNFKVIKKCVEVKTNFKENLFTIDFYCIFHIRIVHIIVVGIKFLLYQRSKREKFKKVIGGGISG